MKTILMGLLLILAPLSLTSCRSTVVEATNPPPQNPENLPAEFPIKNKSVPAVKTPEPFIPTITITRYKIDGQCQSLQPSKLEVPQAKSIEKTIETIIGDRSNGDFRIAGYRLKVDPQTKVATIDIRLPQDSPRTIHSLSQCEQLALFGELRETLLKHNDWAIDTVQFQLQGVNI